MASFSQIWQKLKGVVNTVLNGRTIQQVLHITPAISDEMENAIRLWDKMYSDNAPWLHEPDGNDPVKVASLGLPAMIASEKARMALIEFKSEITTPTEEVEIDNPNYTEPEPDIFGNIIPSSEPLTIIEDKPIGNTERADYLNKQYKKLKDKLRVEIESGIAKGGLVIKPYLVQNSSPDAETTYTIEFDFIQADAFFPLGFDTTGRIIEAAFIEEMTEKDKIYRRVEHHTWAGNSVTIENKAFVTTNSNTSSMNSDTMLLGKEIKLTEIPQWSNMREKTTINNVDRPLYAYFKMPLKNTVDKSSKLGISAFERAKKLIKDADEQYSRLLWEYEGGELAVDIDRDALRTDVDENGNTKTRMNHSQERLFRKVDLGSTGDTYQPYAPSLRDTSYIQGLNTILMRIEDVVALSRGTLSDGAQEARTATELKILKQRSYQANADIQQAIQATLEDVVYIMNVYASLYEITPEGEYDVSFEWDDSIITDVDTELTKRLTLMQNGLAGKVETRMWYFGETERQAKEALAQIDGENMAEMENDLAMQANQMQLGATNKINQQQQISKAKVDEAQAKSNVKIKEKEQLNKLKEEKK